MAVYGLMIRSSEQSNHYTIGSAAWLRPGVSKIISRKGLLFLGVVSMLGAGCRTIEISDASVGHACHRNFSYREEPRFYVCLFELSAPSAFYSTENIQDVLEAFIETEGGDCRIWDERSMVDRELQDIDHFLNYRYFRISCETPGHETKLDTHAIPNSVDSLAGAEVVRPTL